MKNNFLPTNLPIYKIVGVLPSLFISAFFEENSTSHNHVFSNSLLLLLFDGVLHDVAVVVFSNSLLLLLFGDVLHDVAVVVFLNSLLAVCGERQHSDDKHFILSPNFNAAHISFTLANCHIFYPLNKYE